MCVSLGIHDLLGYLAHKLTRGAPRVIIGGFSNLGLDLWIVHHHIGTGRRTQQENTWSLHHANSVKQQPLNVIFNLSNRCFRKNVTTEAANFVRNTNVISVTANTFGHGCVQNENIYTNSKPEGQTRLAAAIVHDRHNIFQSFTNYLNVLDTQTLLKKINKYRTKS